MAEKKQVSAAGIRIMRRPKISFETDRLFIRSVVEEDKETY